jgi:hypothetical protein
MKFGTQGFGTGTGFFVFSKNQNHWDLGFLRTGTGTRCRIFGKQKFFE